jgi:flagellar biosynthesis protein FliQ
MINKINLQLFAQGAGGEDRTEKATPRKRSDARKKGQVLQSREISSAMVLLFVFISLRVFGKSMYTVITEYMKKVLTEYPKIEDLYTPDILSRVFVDGVTVFAKAVGPVLLVALLSGLIVSYVQVGFLFTTETLKPQFSRINPLNGIKRMFSLRSVVELVKSVMKVIVIRHGERDYEPCYERGFIGMGLELAPLTEIGEKQAEEVALNELLRGTEIILSSPYTRCMQTSAIISRIRNIPLKVEIDLHEWVPDLTYQN